MSAPQQPGRPMVEICRCGHPFNHAPIVRNGKCEKCVPCRSGADRIRTYTDFSQAIAWMDQCGCVGREEPGRPAVWLRCEKHRSSDGTPENPPSLCRRCGHYMGEFNRHDWDQDNGPDGTCIYCRACNRVAAPEGGETGKERG
jgi:hypothetical protein